jgi:hypothetical protein
MDVPLQPFWQEIAFAEGRIARVTQLEAAPVGWADAARIL